MNIVELMTYGAEDDIAIHHEGKGQDWGHPLFLPHLVHSDRSARPVGCYAIASLASFVKLRTYGSVTRRRENLGKNGKLVSKGIEILQKGDETLTDPSDRARRTAGPRYHLFGVHHPSHHTCVIPSIYVT
jgi:hypothetical protein